MNFTTKFHQQVIMFFILHILLMVSATLGITIGIVTAMFFRKKKNWLKIHKTVNLFSFGGFAAGITIAFIYVAASSGKHLNGIHQVFGLASFIIAFMTLIMGYYQFKVKNKSTARTAHRWMGRISLLAFLTTITLGLMLINIF